jgi:integrase
MSDPKNRRTKQKLDSERMSEPWTPEHLRAFFQSVDAHRTAALWHMLRELGCTLGEALALQWPDVDIEEQTLNIHRTVATGVPRTVIEAEIPRVMGLSWHLTHCLGMQAERQAVEKMAAGRTWQTDEAWVFTTEAGARLDAGWVRQQFRTWTIEARMPLTVRLHDWQI